MRISDQFEESLSPYTDLAAQPLPALPLATPATIVPSGRRVAGQPYVRPALSPHGHPWPTRTGYLKGCPVRWDDGHGQITVDNTRNDSDVHVKLVGTDGVIVREAFIKEGTEMLFKDLRPGPYQVRYRDLDSGALAKADPFDLTEERTSRGITYSSISLTLYKVAHGNTELQPMSEEEF